MLCVEVNRNFNINVNLENLEVSMKRISFLLLVLGYIFTNQLFAGVAVTKTPVDGDGNVFWTVDFTGNALHDQAQINVSFEPTFDPTTYIQKVGIRVFDFNTMSLITCNYLEYISKTNNHYGINYKPSAVLAARTKGSSKFSDNIRITVNNSNCTEIENGEEGASPSVDPNMVFSGIGTMRPPRPYPSQRIASYTHESHFSSEPGTSKGSLILSPNGLTRTLTLTYKTGEVFSCLVYVGSPMDDFVLAAKPHVVLKGGTYVIRKNITGIYTGSCISIAMLQNSTKLQ